MYARELAVWGIASASNGNLVAAIVTQPSQANEDAAGKRKSVEIIVATLMYGEYTA